MQSITKTELPNSCIEQIIKKILGSQASISEIVELTEGYYNSAYRITCTDGTKYVLKVAPPDDVPILRYEKNILQAEVDVMRLVKKRTEMPVPAILCHDASRTIVSSPYYLMEYVEGVLYHQLRSKLTAQEQAGLDRRIGELLRQMNAITAERFGYFAQPETHLPGWKEAFEGMLSGVIDDGIAVGVRLAMPKAEMIERLQPYFHALDEVTLPQLIHWDLWDGNIFVNPENLTIAGIIDFERAIWADPLMEVNFGAFGDNPEFNKGYGIDFPLSQSQSIRRTLYNIYLFLIMVIEPTYRRYPSQDQENWARQQLQAQFEKLDA
jgi:aminoglycoside phosphotransferase (APT) family kinase protein